MSAAPRDRGTTGTGTRPVNAAYDTRRLRRPSFGLHPLSRFSSLKLKLSLIITVSTAIAFVMAWEFLKYGVSGWIAMPLSLAVSLSITYFFSRGLISPLEQMRDAAEAMAQGDYTVRVKPTSTDEIGQLASSFDVMAEELEHADQMRRDLIANVSHELRTPVSVLQAQMENMADGVTPATPVNLESTLDQTHRLADLIAFLLDMSRVEAGAASLNVERFDFSEFLDDTIAPLKIADAGHGHVVESDVPDDLFLEGDEARLRQLFTNLISNAMKHSADGTRIIIEARVNKSDDTIVTNVVNFGSQIPTADRSNIFRRYVKGSDSGKPGTSSGGTGLGLSIARWAAQLHGGSVRVVDDRRGANFEVRLPIHHHQDEADPDPAGIGMEADTAPSSRII